MPEHPVLVRFDCEIWFDRDQLGRITGLDLAEFMASAAIEKAQALGLDAMVYMQSTEYRLGWLDVDG